MESVAKSVADTSDLPTAPGLGGRPAEPNTAYYGEKGKPTPRRGGSTQWGVSLFRASVYFSVLFFLRL